MQNIRLGAIRYNDQIGAFEARVDVERDQGVFRYPCRLSAPRDMAEDKVRLGLACQALGMSDSSFRSRTTEIGFRSVH